MKKAVFNTVKYAFALIAIALTIAGLAGYVDIFSVTGVGLAMAFAGAAEVSQETVTTQVTSEKSTELLTNTIDKKIAKMRPDRYPLDTMLREMGIIVPIQSWKTEYYAVETRDLEDAVVTEFAATGYYSSPSASEVAWTVKDVVVGKMHMWNVDDIVMVQGVNGADGKELILHVVRKTEADDKLGVEAVNGFGTNAADIPVLPVATKLTRIGNAKSEKDAQTTPYSTFPQKDYNYAQIHMAQVEQSLYDALHNKEVEWNLSDFRSEAIWDLRGQMELASLFGARLKLYDKIGADWKYMSGGVIRYITKALTYSSSVTNANFVTLAKSIFTGNNGSDTRVVLAGSGMRAAWGSVPTIQKQMEQRNVEVVWGVKFNRIETDFGTLLVKNHPTLDYAGWTNHGICLDMANIEKHVFKSMETTDLELIKSGQRKANANVIDEAFCPVLKNPDTHAVIKLT